MATCTAMAPIRGATSGAGAEAATSPATGSARAAAKPILTGAGIDFVPNGGTRRIQALARTRASRNPTSRSVSPEMVTEPLEERRHALEEVLGERDHLVEHPAAADDHDDGHADQL